MTTRNYFFLTLSDLRWAFYHLRRGQWRRAHARDLAAAAWAREWVRSRFKRT